MQILDIEAISNWLHRPFENECVPFANNGLAAGERKLTISMEFIENIHEMVNTLKAVSKTNFKYELISRTVVF